jgi:hypothetical protein
MSVITVQPKQEVGFRDVARNINYMWWFHGMCQHNISLDSTRDYPKYDKGIDYKPKQLPLLAPPSGRFDFPNATSKNKVAIKNWASVARTGVCSYYTIDEENFTITINFTNSFGVRTQMVYDYYLPMVMDRDALSTNCFGLSEPKVVRTMFDSKRTSVMSSKEYFTGYEEKPDTIMAMAHSCLIYHFIILTKMWFLTRVVNLPDKVRIYRRQVIKEVFKDVA